VTFFAAIGAWLLGHVVNFFLAMFGGWMLMLAVGVAHGEWITQLPTIGYWWAVLIVWLLQGSFKTIDFSDSK